MNKRFHAGLVTVITSLLLFWQQGACAAQRLEGCFLATQDCEAFRSIRKATNPGNIRLVPEKTYPIKAQNRPNNPSHYQIHIDGITTPNRWVAISCGKYISNCTMLPRKKPASSNQYLLALSWEPAFCETHPQKSECQSIHSRRYDARNLALHGLWPQPRNNAYCGVSDKNKTIDRHKRWDLLEPLKLSIETKTTLAKIMPGFASNLQRHEWIKHGTCYGTSAEIYYQHALALTKQINNSQVGKLFASNIGRKISAHQIRTAFEQSFGKGAGNKVTIRCDRKGNISELWINLQGKINLDTPLDSLMTELISDAPRAKKGCTMGKVDAAS
jgi:ribonuclease T2